MAVASATAAALTAAVAVAAVANCTAPPDHRIAATSRRQRRLFVTQLGAEWVPERRSLLQTPESSRSRRCRQRCQSVPESGGSAGQGPSAPTRGVSGSFSSCGGDGAMLDSGRSECSEVGSAWCREPVQQLDPGCPEVPPMVAPVGEARRADAPSDGHPARSVRDVPREWG